MWPWPARCQLVSLMVLPVSIIFQHKITHTVCRGLVLLVEIGLVSFMWWADVLLNKLLWSIRAIAASTLRLTAVCSLGSWASASIGNWSSISYQGCLPKARKKGVSLVEQLTDVRYANRQGSTNSSQLSCSSFTYFTKALLSTPLNLSHWPLDCGW